MENYYEESKEWQSKIAHKPMKQPEVIARPCNDSEMEQFIARQSQPKMKRKGWTRRSRTYWSSKCTWDLRNGKSVFFDGRLINPPVLDISNYRKAI